MIYLIAIILLSILFALLAISYELYTITARLIEIGTIVEHANRRSLRASIGETEGDYADESITTTHRKWSHMVGAIFLGTAVVAILVVFLRDITQ